MAVSLSELGVGYDSVPGANIGSNLTFYQKLYQQVDWILALNLDWQATGIFVAVMMAIFTTFLFALTGRFQK